MLAENVASSWNGTKHETFFLLDSIFVNKAFGNSKMDIGGIVNGDLLAVGEVKRDDLAGFVVLQGRRKRYAKVFGGLNNVGLRGERSVGASESGVKDRWERRRQREIVDVTCLALETDCALRYLLEIKVFDEALKHVADLVG